MITKGQKKVIHYLKGRAYTKAVQAKRLLQSINGEWGAQIELEDAILLIVEFIEKNDLKNNPKVLDKGAE